MHNTGDGEDPGSRLPLQGFLLHRWHITSIAVVVLGLFSLVMLLWIYHFNEHLRMEITICDALKDIRINTASSHLWLEEFVAGNDTVDIRTVKANMNAATRLADAILNGGPSEQGLMLRPLEDQNLRKKTEAIQALLTEFEVIGNLRLQDPARGKIGSPPARDFDMLFKTIQERLEAVEAIIEKKHTQDQIDWRFTFISIVVAWIAVLLIAITALWNQEGRRKAAARALLRANGELRARTEELRDHEEHLQELVRRRTAELTAANQALQQENVERKKVEESLRASERRFKSLVEHLPMSIALKDRNSIYQYCNHACARELEIAPDEVYGKTDRDFFPPELADTHIAEDRRILVSGKTEEKTEKYLKHGQEVIVRKIKLPIKYGDGDVADSLLCIVQDITEKTRLESIAEAANAMENVGFVFAGVRHELGNPVNSIKLTLRILASKIDTSPVETAKEYIDRAMAEIERMEYLLRTLKNFNMYETLDLQDVPLKNFLKRLLSLAAGDFERKGILIRSYVQPEALSVTADPRALQQALLNIMQNAADALAGRKEPEIAIRVSKMDGFIGIAVTDNGSGMSEEQQQALFKPFHTTKAGGTGLGLVITKKMITGMKGAIAVRSQEGIGTTVEISLPAGPGTREGGKR